MPRDTVSARVRVVGGRTPVPILGGTTLPFVNLDNAASTPPLRRVQQAVDRLGKLYASVHRGAGFKSQISTWALEQARQVVLRFTGADPATHTAVFTRNTTEAINRLARLLAFDPDDVVLVTQMEHHANDLPWRARTTVRHTRVTASGELDMADLEHQLATAGGRIRLVAVTGASNVTGFINPVYEIARLAHAHGARILVDAAQLAPHRPIRMAQTDPAAHIDFLALSGHKLYAPYGAGVLIAPTEFLEAAEPDQSGGGAIEVVSLDEVHLAAAPDRVEPGTPNTLGVVAMAQAMQALMNIGMEQVAAHEQALVRYALQQLGRVPGLILYGSADPERTADRTGVIPFNLRDMPHGLVAAILGQEAAVGVRNGCFCAHPYVIHLLGVDGGGYSRFRDRVLSGDRSDVPGLVRASFGVYNTRSDVDRLVAALGRVARGEYSDGYQLNPVSGEYSHPDYRPDFSHYFHLDA